MPPIQLIAYYRVSTQRQGDSGLGLDAQRAAVAAYAQHIGAIVGSEYQEIESGRRNDRPQLSLALVDARARKGTLVVAKLDRLARDARFLLGLVDTGVPIVFGDLPELAAGDPIVGRLTLTVLAAIAEFEARRIAQRIREAAAAKKARGGIMGWATRKDGLNPMTDEHRRQGSAAAREVNLAAALEYRHLMQPVIWQLQAQGMSLAQVAAELNARGYTTRRGRPWSLSTVHAIMRQLPGSSASGSPKRE